MNKVYFQKAYFLTSIYYLLLFKLLHVYILHACVHCDSYEDYREASKAVHDKHIIPLSCLYKCT